MKATSSGDTKLKKKFGFTFKIRINKYKFSLTYDMDTVILRNTIHH